MAFGQSNHTLPVKRVVLYKNGVGYFEHLGRVNGNQDVTIPFTSGQLNDALKSLTLLDLNGGRITGVEYASSAPIDRQLGDLRLPAGGKTTLTDLMSALRGAKLEVRSLPGPAVTGRLLSVERKTRVAGGNTLEVDYISLLTESGEIRTTEVSPSFSVRLLESGLPGKVNRMLDLLSLGREPDLRRMVVSTQGSGERGLFVSYISEVPVWKATYRVVLNPKNGKSPLLQGWAIVDNTVGQDWENVELSLVAGAPQSFIQDLSQPYYSRRPVVPLPEQAMSTPQTFQATLIPGSGRVAGSVTDASGAALSAALVRAFDAPGKVVASSVTDAAGAYELSGLPEGMVRIEIESIGFKKGVVQGVIANSALPGRYDARLEVGSTAGAIEISASTPPLSTSTSTVSKAGRSLGTGRGLGAAGKSGPSGVGQTNIGALPARAQAREEWRAAASGQDLGDLFEYKLKDPITIQKNKSALVPIVNAHIGAEKVSVWNETSGYTRPQRALWLDNTSGLTLDGGSFSVLEEETFAGEGIFDAIRPAEKRLVSYAADLAMNAGSRRNVEHQRVSRCIVNKGTMIHESEAREKKTYTFRNEDKSARTILVEHPVRPEFRLRNDIKPVETAAGWMRFRVPVASKQTMEFVVDESRPIESRFAVSNVTPEQIAEFVEGRAITPEIEQALRRILAQKAAVANLESQKEARDGDQDKIFDDQQRLRENMKSLKGSAEEKALLQRYTQQLNAQETRLEELRKALDQLDEEISKAQVALDQMIESLVFDVKL
jgi:hypothetical protein